MIHFPTHHDPKRTGYQFLSWVKSQGLYHSGIDFNWGVGSQDKGQEVICPTWGIVVYVSPKGTNGGLGLYVVIQHPHNGAYTRCMHLLDVTVVVGEKVYPKQIIGHLGASGTSSPHLHFEVMNDKGFAFIQTGPRPYGRYTKGLSRSQVADLWIDPIEWLSHQEHYSGPSLNQKLNQVENAIRFSVPPRKNMLQRLANRLRDLRSHDPV